MGADGLLGSLRRESWAMCWLQRRTSGRLGLTCDREEARIRATRALLNRATQLHIALSLRAADWRVRRHGGCHLLPCFRIPDQHARLPSLAKTTTPIDDRPPVNSSILMRPSACGNMCHHRGIASSSSRCCFFARYRSRPAGDLTQPGHEKANTRC
jgi:hypothetical protein